MSGTEFEDYVARIARSCGVPVIMTSITGDWGVDLIIGHRPNRLAVQCKRLSRPVGAGAVQEVVAGAPMQDCTQTMVVTNHEFTPAARKLAERHGCELVGGADLPRLRSTIRRLTPAGRTRIPLSTARTASTAASISSRDTVSAGRNRTLSDPLASMITPRSHSRRPARRAVPRWAC